MKPLHAGFIQAFYPLHYDTLDTVHQIGLCQFPADLLEGNTRQVRRQVTGAVPSHRGWVWAAGYKMEYRNHGRML